MTPTVSCLMVTRDRPALADRAIRCFAAQRYPARELIIVSQGGPDYTVQLRSSLRAYGVHRALLVEADPALRLGALRNLSLDAAHGDLVCVWDDDDLSHPDRLAVQIAALREAGAHSSFFTDHFQLFAPQHDLHWIDWNRPPVSDYPVLPTTMLMTRDGRFRYPTTGRYEHRGEDWQLLLDLHAAVPVQHLAGRGHLYMYTYHGRNVFSEAHHGHMRIRSRPRAEILADADLIRSALAAYPPLGPLRVSGCDGPAFTVEPTA
ncbi:glycosyltransferase family 2 protein [Actinoplanes sp. NPDC051851]|uniref:glycosyltransferase family 2 protein n=1 Tax=Actinoplanes sp. NPDC051851 TaxID=3154753 RepID=UPI003426BABD